MPKIRPLIKPYSETVKLAAYTYNMSITEIEIIMDRKLQDLRISKMAVMIYVNWASHNALTYSELAKALGLTVQTIKVHLQTIRRRFPYLFISDPGH